MNTLLQDLERNADSNPGDKLICKACGHTFIRGGMCFYGICDDCFIRFDTQKMQARFGGVKGTESVDEWILTEKELKRVKTKKEMIRLAMSELRDGVESIYVIERLQKEGRSAREAEELVDQAMHELSLPENR